MAKILSEFMLLRVYLARGELGSWFDPLVGVAGIERRIFSIVALVKAVVAARSMEVRSARK